MKIFACFKNLLKHASNLPFYSMDNFLVAITQTHYVVQNDVFADGPRLLLIFQEELIMRLRIIGTRTLRKN